MRMLHFLDLKHAEVSRELSNKLQAMELSWWVFIFAVRF